jgi:hypothetical protein
MSQRIINLTDVVIWGEIEKFTVPVQQRDIPVAVQTGVKHDRGVRFREVSEGFWSYEIRRKHCTTFGGPVRGLPAAMQRAERVVVALADLKLSV